MFPGQGTQRVGMGFDLLKQWKHIVNPIFEETNDILKLNLKDIMLFGPQERLSQTSIAQPAILCYSYLVQQILHVRLCTFSIRWSSRTVERVRIRINASCSTQWR